MTIGNAFAVLAQTQRGGGDLLSVPASPLPGHSPAGDITLVSVFVVIMMVVSVAVLALLGWRFGLFRGLFERDVPDDPDELRRKQ